MRLPLLVGVSNTLPAHVAHKATLNKLMYSKLALYVLYVPIPLFLTELTKNSYNKEIFEVVEMIWNTW